jgi:xanthine dehydrogenase iron-sulfur cluster and FAD-binding subunit A
MAASDFFQGPITTALKPDELLAEARLPIVPACSRFSRCTPGFVMLAIGVLGREPYIGDEALLDILASNLCRCTGYQSIVAAIRAAIAELRRSKGPV